MRSYDAARRSRTDLEYVREPAGDHQPPPARGRLLRDRVTRERVSEARTGVVDVEDERCVLFPRTNARNAGGVAENVRRQLAGCGLDVVRPVRLEAGPPSLRADEAAGRERVVDVGLCRAERRLRQRYPVDARRLSPYPIVGCVLRASSTMSGASARASYGQTSQTGCGASARFRND